MKIRILIAVFNILSVSLFSACKNHKEQNELVHSHEHHEGHSHSHTHPHEDDENEDDEIKLEPEKAEKLGVKTQEIHKNIFSESIKVTGEITAPPFARKTVIAKNSGILSLNKSTVLGTRLVSGQQLGKVNGSSITGGDLSQAVRLEYEQAKKELERVTPLYEKGVISAKEFNAIKKEFDRASLALGDAKTVSNEIIVSPMTGILISLNVNDGDYVEAGQAIGVVGDNVTLSFEADLPKRYHSKADEIIDAFIIPGCGDCEVFSILESGGKRIDGNPSINNNSSGFMPIYFSFPNNGILETTGIVDAFLITKNNHEALTVPETALFEQQGKWFLYVQLDEDCYEKRTVKKGGSNGLQVEILEGIDEGDVVVTEGVTFIRLAENADIIPEGHTHNH